MEAERARRQLLRGAGTSSAHHTTSTHLASSGSVSALQVVLNAKDRPSPNFPQDIDFT